MFGHWCLRLHNTRKEDRSSKHLLASTANVTPLNAQAWKGTASVQQQKSFNSAFQSAHTSHNGYQTTSALRHTARPTDQYHEPPRELLLQVLPLPCPELAATKLCGCGCKPAILLQLGKSAIVRTKNLTTRLPGITTQKDPIRCAEDRRLRTRKDGGGPTRWHSARTHHIPQCYENAQAVRVGGEAHAPEP